MCAWQTERGTPDYIQYIYKTHKYNNVMRFPFTSWPKDTSRQSCHIRGSCWSLPCFLQLQTKVLAPRPSLGQIQEDHEPYLLPLEALPWMEEEPIFCPPSWLTYCVWGEEYQTSSCEAWWQQRWVAAVCIHQGCMSCTLATSHSLGSVNIQTHM